MSHRPVWIVLVACLVLSVCASYPGVARAASFAIRDGHLVLPAPVAFEAGTDRLKSSSQMALGHVRSFLLARTDVTLLRVEGHVAAGAPGGGQQLSQKRALRVCRWLVAHGIDCKRLLPVGFGMTKPVASNATAAGRAANDRAVFSPALLRNRPVGGMPIDGGGMIAGDPCK